MPNVVPRRATTAPIVLMSKLSKVDKTVGKPPSFEDLLASPKNEVPSPSPSAPTATPPECGRVMERERLDIVVEGNSTFKMSEMSQVIVLRRDQRRYHI
jgi:hypothetical protein